ITGGQLLGMICAIVGATLVVTRGDLSSIRNDPGTRGNLLLALSGALWAIYSVASKPTLERVPPAALTAVASTISLSILAPAALLELHASPIPPTVGPWAIAAVVGLGIFVSFGATFLWNLSLRDISATRMAALIF